VKSWLKPSYKESITTSPCKEIILERRIILEEIGGNRNLVKRKALEYTFYGRKRRIFMSFREIA